MTSAGDAMKSAGEKMRPMNDGSRKKSREKWEKRRAGGREKIAKERKVIPDPIDDRKFQE